MKVIRSLTICALSAMHLSLYSCDEYYYYDCDEQINSLAPLPLSENEKDVKYLLKLDATFDQEMDYEAYRQKIKNITDLLVEEDEEDKEAKDVNNKFYLSYEKYRKAWNKANPNNQIKINLPKGIDLNKIRVKQSDVEKNDYKNKRYEKTNSYINTNQGKLTPYNIFHSAQNILYGISDDLRSNNDETFKNCLVHHIVNLMLFLPNEELDMSERYDLQVGKYDYDGFIAAFNKLKYIIKNSQKSTDRNENDIENLFKTIQQKHNEQELKKFTGKSFQDLKNDINSKKIDISLKGENLCILQYNHNYDLKERIIERMEIFRDEIFKTLNDSGFLGFINTSLFRIRISQWIDLKYNGTICYEIITPFGYEEKPNAYGCITPYVQGLTGKQNAIMSFYKHKLSTDDGKNVNCDHKFLIKQINCNKDLKVDELGVIKNVPDNMIVLEYLKHLLENEINMNFFNDVTITENTIYAFNDTCKDGKFSMLLSNFYNNKQGKGSDFWRIVEYPLGNNIYTNYIKENYNTNININFVSKNDFFEKKNTQTIYIDRNSMPNFLNKISLNSFFPKTDNESQSRQSVTLYKINNKVNVTFPGTTNNTYIKTTQKNYQSVLENVYLCETETNYGYAANPDTINKFLESINIHDNNLTNKYAEIKIEENKENGCNINFSVPFQFYCDGNTYDQTLFNAIYFSNGNLRTDSYTSIDMALDSYDSRMANINVVSDDIFNQFEKGKIYRIYLKGKMHDKHTSVFVELDENNNDTNIKILKSITYFSFPTKLNRSQTFKLIPESTANRLKKKADGSEYSYVLCSDNRDAYAGYKLHVNKSDLDNFIFIDKTLAKLQYYNQQTKTISAFYGVKKYLKIKDLKNYITMID